MRKVFLYVRLFLGDTMKKIDNVNKKIQESKKIIKREKLKIKAEKKQIRSKKTAEFKKTKLGKILSKALFLISDKDHYSFSEFFAAVVISLVLGVFACLSVLMILFKGRNIIKLSKELDKFYDAYVTLKENYYGNVDSNNLVDAAIDGMVSSVGDMYTSYNDMYETGNFDEMVNGFYEGIGCTIYLKDKQVVVNDVYEKSPASKAGLKTGDIILQVDDLVASEVGVSKLSNYIKKEADNKVVIKFIRDEKEYTVNVKRDDIEIPTVSSKVFDVNDKKIGYVRIAIFSSVSAKQFKSELEKIEKEGISGLVIDVRDNNGGYLTTVTDIASYLLPKGKVIYQIQRDDDTSVTNDKTAEKRTYPIAILTNKNSASASEILAAVIKESYKGFVVGTKTYGKGTVQQVKKLSDGSMIKYTVEKWLTPNGNWIEDEGVEPTDEVILNDNYYDSPSDESDNQLQKALNLVVDSQ